MIAKRRKRSKKWIYWLVILVLLIVAGVVVYLVWDNYFHEKKDETTETQETTMNKIVEKKEESKEPKKNSEDVEDEKKVKQYEGEDPNESESLTGAVTYAGVAGDKLVIRVNIDQYLNGGECVLNLLKDGTTIYSGTSGITTAATTATCEGFNVPVDAVGEGAVDIVIKVNSGGKVGTISGKAEI